MPSDILDFLIDKAEKDPKKIIEMYEGEDWKMQLFIIDAIERGVIRKSEGIFKYDDKMLGGTMEATVLFLRNPLYRKILDSIRLETYPNLRPKSEIKELETESANILLNTDNTADSEVGGQKPTTRNNKK